MLIASVIMRALISIPDAMPARSAGTAPVVVLVTGVLVRPRPAPARMQPGNMVHAPGCAALTAVFHQHEAEADRKQACRYRDS